jgi:hypothetical protein
MTANRVTRIHQFCVGLAQLLIEILPPGEQDAETTARERVARNRNRKLNLTPKRRAQLRLQGLYLGHMKGLGLRDQQAMKRVRLAEGVKAAIAYAKRVAA